MYPRCPSVAREVLDIDKKLGQCIVYEMKLIRKEWNDKPPAPGSFSMVVFKLIVEAASTLLENNVDRWGEAIGPLIKAVAVILLWVEKLDDFDGYSWLDSTKIPDDDDDRGGF